MSITGLPITKREVSHLDPFSHHRSPPSPGERGGLPPVPILLSQDAPITEREERSPTLPPISYKICVERKISLCSLHSWCLVTTSNMTQYL